MAIIIQSGPIEDAPVHSPLLYVVQSTNETEDNFKYFLRLFLDGEFLGEIKSDPDPSGGWGKFDISNICSSYLDFEWNFEDGSFGAGEGSKEFTVEFGEEYFQSGSFIRNENELQVSRTLFNASPFYREYSELTADHRFVINGTPTGKYPLTSRRTIETVDGTKQWVYYLMNNYADGILLEIRDDDTNDNAYFLLDGSAQNFESGKIIAYRCDREFIEANTLLSGLENWSVRITDQSGNPSSEFVSFERLSCNRWDNYSLYYLNRWGGMDSMSFNGRIQRTVGTDRTSFKRRSYTISSGGIVDYDSKRHTTKDYSVSYTNTFQLNTTWIKQESMDSLIDLQTSPIVWLEDPDGVILPVNILQDTFEFKERQNGVISAVVEVEYEQPTKRQRG